MDLSPNNNKVDFFFSVNQNHFHLTTDALKASTRKRASCFNKERHLDPPASESFSYLLLMTKLDPMLATMSFYAICHPRRRIGCPVRSQSQRCQRNEYKLNKKRRFSEKLTVLIIVISDAMIPVNSGTFFSFWLSHPQWVTPSARILFIVIVFLFSRLLPSVLVQRYIFYKTRVCRWKHVSPVWI